MLKHDPITNRIVCPRGDTGTITIEFTNPTGGSLDTHITGVAIFAVANKKLTSIYCTKAVSIENDTITIRLSNSDTRRLPIGTHCWDVRIVTDPEYGLSGEVICDDTTDDVHSIFASTGMPDFVVQEVVINV